LVGGYDHRATRDADTYWEFYLRKAVDKARDLVVEFAADIVVNRNCNRHFSVGWKVSFVGREDQCDTLVVGQEELLLFLKSFGLGESIPGHRAELLSLLMLVRENWLGSLAVTHSAVESTRLDTCSKLDLSLV